MEKPHLLIEFCSRMKKSFPGADVRQIEIDCGLVHAAAVLGIIGPPPHTHTHKSIKPQINQNTSSYLHLYNRNRFIIPPPTRPLVLSFGSTPFKQQPASLQSIRLHLIHLNFEWSPVAVVLHVFTVSRSNVSSRITVHHHALVIPFSFIVLFLFSFSPLSASLHHSRPIP